MAADHDKLSTRTGSWSRIGRVRAIGDETPLRTMLDDVVASPLGPGFVVAAVFFVLASLVVLWARETPMLAVGRVMDDTRLVRVEIESDDLEKTRQDRESERQTTARVYVADVPVLDAIESSLRNLPKTLAGVKALSDVDPGIVQQFHLTPELLEAVKAEARNGEPTEEWRSRVAALVASLKRRPIVDRATWQQSVQEGLHRLIRLFVGSEELPLVFRSELLNSEDAKSLAEAMTILARDAGFSGPLREVVVYRLTEGVKPTFRYDAAATARDQDKAAAAIKTAKRVSKPPQVIYQRGEILTQEQADLYRQEAKRFDQTADLWRILLRRLSLAGIVFGVTAALVGYTLLFAPRVKRNAARMIGVASILLGALAAACVLSAVFPSAREITSVLPTVAVALIVAIGYDRRAALAYALLQGLLTVIALDQGAGTMVVMIAGIACIVTTLREIRDRSSLLRMSVSTGLGLAIVMVLMALVDRPLLVSSVPGLGRVLAGDMGLQVLRESLTDAALAGLGVIAIGGSTMLFLPRIERVFDVTTGMTLMELRDPKQPLLREMQLRAPGTYNHALNVATIAESAAEAISADSLLTYVGALYHDIGKMNKPEYFVENQTPGINKHDRLSPAMSLLVVVGHVKDGLELAREFKLPRSVQHFIESHHGTTLVEYFYHRAKKQAVGKGLDAGDESHIPDEVEYRYPGPRPRTKEAAVLMVADAVESATRAMSDPTPSRIETLVRGLANKRLLDGQFDECELTLRELTQIVDSISRTLTSMYHGRIAYPTEVRPTQVVEGPRTGEVVVESKRA
jgi:putative nucleotidyltransferase with HDIG domain